MERALAGGSIRRKESKSELIVGAVSPLTTPLLYPKPDRQREVPAVNHYTKNFSLIHHDRVVGFEYIEFRLKANFGRLEPLVIFTLSIC